MKVTVDEHSGFCFGVEFAIQMAEDEMEHTDTLFCLGDIVHNDMEVNRLHEKGLRVINREELKNLHNCKVLIRAHGEPPETYRIALENNIEIIDASCPVVLKLQNRIRDAHETMKKSDGQIIIYGKEGHAEVIGLSGQTNDRAVVISSEDDLEKIDFKRPITLFSQTTKSTDGFYHIVQKIKDRVESDTEGDEVPFVAHDSICRQVSNRVPQLLDFSSAHDVILFVSSKKSSNGKALFEKCREQNSRSHFIEDEHDIEADWFDEKDSIGICGATSTPRWLMEKIERRIHATGLEKATI